MKFLIQRVNRANVRVNNEKVGEINKGLLVFIGITHEDTKEIADYMVNKLINLRIFADEKEKLNLSVKDVEGELLLVSQFTLYGDCNKGNRPSFVEAAKSEYAKELYEYIIEECKKKIKVVQKGIFGADMKIELVNDGPVTIMITR